MVVSFFVPFGLKADAAGTISVADAIANNSGTATVEGYIVGTVNGGSGTSITYKHSGPFTADTNLALADKPDETDRTKIIPVQLPSGAIRTDLNLKANPDNLGKKVQITGALEAYFATAGLKNPTAYHFVEAGDVNKAEAVTAAPGSGAVAAGTLVSLTTGTDGAQVYYTTDGSAPGKGSTLYSDPIKIERDTVIKAIAVKDGLQDSDAAEFTYTVASVKSIADVRQLPVGSSAVTAGVVTAVFGSTVYIQDETAGLVLYGSNLNLTQGDRVQASGKLADYNSLLELEVKAADVTVTGHGEVPQAQVASAGDFKEENEGKLLTVKKVSVESLASGTFTAKDALGVTFQIRPQDASLLAAGTAYDEITGVLGAYKGVYQLIPRDAADIIQDASRVQPVTANPGSGLIPAGGKVALSTRTQGAVIHYTTDGSEPKADSPVYEGPIVISRDTVIKAIAVKAGLTDSAAAVFNYVLQKDEIRIHDIQGAGHYSLYDFFNVPNVAGIVTKIVDANNFYMQDPKPDADDKTSEGILVYKKAHGLQTGDAVSVSGVVKEFVLEGYAEKQQTDLPVTEINASVITKTGSGQALPKAVKLGVDRTLPTEVIDNDGLKEFDPVEDGIDFYESLEGMLVEVDDAKIVAPQRYGELVVIPGNMETNTSGGGLRITEMDYNPERITIDINDEKFVAKMGDRFKGSIGGVVSYGFSAYKVLSDKAELPQFVEGGNERETTSISADNKKLTVASYNVENFSAQDADAKVTKLAQAIVSNLNQPDIIGLTEMQDNDGETNSGNTDAGESFATLINKIKELGGAAYSYTDIAPENNKDGGAPGGNIRVGFLYKADRVTLAPGTKGTATEAVGFENHKLTLNPGRIDPTNPAFQSSRKPLAAQFSFKGRSVIVVANHFNSKGGDTPLFGKVQPPVLGSEVQRMKIAGIVNGFVKDVKSKDPDANLILLGDFNDFEFSNPLKTLKGNELTNMIEKVPAEDRYSYSYQGNAQVLDHILVSNNIAPATKVDIVHINSGFMEEHGRASDHDPVIIQTTPAGEEKLPPAKDGKRLDLKRFVAKQWTVAAQDSWISLDAASMVTNGLHLKKTTTLDGEGLKNTVVVLDPTGKEAAFNFSSAEVKEVVIDSSKITEIWGAENIQSWKIEKGSDITGITFYNKNGDEVVSPLLPKKNTAPVLGVPFADKTAGLGESAVIDLKKHFQDADGDQLTFTSTAGNLSGAVLTLPTGQEGTVRVTVTASDGKAEAKGEFTLTVVKAGEAGGYYQNAEGKTGAALKAALHSIIKPQTKLTYSQITEAIKDTDEDPNNPNNVILLYTGRSQAKSAFGSGADDWNREHVWAKSHGDFGTTVGPGTDLHHLRPTDASVNSTRGNLDFDNGGKQHSECTQCYYDSDSWEPPNRVKGDIARMLFYMAVRYEGDGEIDLELANTVNNSPKPLHGKLSTLLQWNEQDPVDEFERHRNNVIFEKWQHNRNPFIDHPEWADAIWSAS
ncbi:endonuclease [Peribacillus sp. SCS-26]|uniref:endonuclease n=1 Tax=Paraperibacillus marinus TaxID=3115295 RepID=UPI003905B02E